MLDVINSGPIPSAFRTECGCSGCSVLIHSHLCPHIFKISSSQREVWCNIMWSDDTSVAIVDFLEHQAELQGFTGTARRLYLVHRLLHLALWLCFLSFMTSMCLYSYCGFLVTIDNTQSMEDQSSQRKSWRLYRIIDSFRLETLLRSSSPAVNPVL